jgi:hypothetical protein
MIRPRAAVSPATRRDGFVRRFDKRDIPLVVQLHRRVWREAAVDVFDLDAYHDYFMQVFVDNPALDPAMPSLVYEDDEGRLVGFVGVVPRRMTIDGRQFRAVVSSQFIVDPGTRVGLVALKLAKEFLDGPQELSIADEANDVSRRIWEGLGGTTALLHSIYWTRPLRPGRYAVSLVRNRPSLMPLAAAAAPVAAIVDTLATRIRASHFCQAPPPFGADELEPPAVLELGPQFCGASSLRVRYDDRTFQWLLDRAARRREGGELLKVVVKEESKVAGWYICHIAPNGTADVVQLAATATSIDDVLDHLFYQAWQRGAVAVTGRLDPRFMQALSDKYCLLHRRGPWVLVNSKRPEILRSFQSGDAWFSRLDGEWSLRF